jgi:hypothetical protein
MKLTATDKDTGVNARLSYELINIQSVKLKNALQIDRETGLVTNRAPLTGVCNCVQYSSFPDLASPVPYQFAAAVADGGRLNASVVVALTITSPSECRPVFVHPSESDTILSMDTSSSASKIVTTVQAVGAPNEFGNTPECSIRYHLLDGRNTSGNNAGAYVQQMDGLHMDEQSGVLTVVDAITSSKDVRVCIDEHLCLCTVTIFAVDRRRSVRQCAHTNGHRDCVEQYGARVSLCTDRVRVACVGECIEWHTRWSCARNAHRPGRCH